MNQYVALNKSVYEIRPNGDAFPVAGPFKTNAGAAKSAAAFAKRYARNRAAK